MYRGHKEPELKLELRTCDYELYSNKIDKLCRVYLRPDTGAAAAALLVPALVGESGIGDGCARPGTAGGGLPDSGRPKPGEVRCTEAIVRFVPELLPVRLNRPAGSVLCRRCAATGERGRSPDTDPTTAPLVVATPVTDVATAAPEVARVARWVCGGDW